MNFNAEELKNTLNKIHRYTTHGDGSIPVYLDWLKGNYERVSEIVKSEDSNLANTCTSLAATFNKLSSKIFEIGTSISTNLEKYINETLANESGATQSLDEINGNLETINSALASI